MKVMAKRIFSLIMIGVLAISLLTGCFSKENDASSGGPQVLRILGGWGGDDSYFRQQWTDVFELSKENVEIEIIPLQQPYNPNQEDEEQEDPRERLKRLLTEGIAPDVIILDNISTLTYLVEEGLVQPLDTFMEKSNFDVNSLVPGIREGIKDAGDGTNMYALAPTFRSKALFYNKDLFDQYEVPYPTDHMTWVEVADLVKRFPKGEGEDRIYGLWNQFGSVSFYDFMEYFAVPLGLKPFDDEIKNVTMNTPEWEAALSEYIALYNEADYPEQDDSGSEVRVWTPDMDAFQSGKAAMSILDSWNIYQLQNRNMYNPEAEGFDWDVVTVPTHASTPGVGGTIYYQGLMAINRNSQNTNLAWDFIAFNNSEKMLKIKSREPGQFVSVAELNQQQDKPANLEAFFALTPAKGTIQTLYASNTQNMWQVFQIADNVMQEILKGEKTLQEGLEEIQEKGQEALDSEE